jgi:histidine triad (HIT) family protein
MSYDQSNIFARILRGEIPCHKVYEDADVIAFMDIMPQAPGHTLVVPKAASRNLLDADPATLARLLPIVQRIATAAKRAFDADGIRVVQFNEPAAGQTVFHLHIHIIPMREGERLGHHGGRQEDHAVLAEHAKKLKAALGA